MNPTEQLDREFCHRLSVSVHRHHPAAHSSSSMSMSMSVSVSISTSSKPTLWKLVRPAVWERCRSDGMEGLPEASPGPVCPPVEHSCFFTSGCYF